METYLRKEARRHGSSLQITNKKIEEDMDKFFNDKTIQDFSRESANMTARDNEEPKAKKIKKNGGRASVSA